jgi:hypothetical protein
MSSTVIACTGAIFLIGSGAAGAMEPFAHMAGTAGAGLGFSQFTISAIVGTCMMLFPITSSLPFAITIILVSICATINALFLR